MEGFQERLGGSLLGGSSSKRGAGFARNSTTGFNMVLQHDTGSIKLETMRDGKFIIRVNGEIVAKEYDLQKAKSIVEEHLDGMKKSTEKPSGISRYNRFKNVESKRGKHTTSTYKKCDMCGKNISARNVNESRSGLNLCNQCKKVQKADVPEGTTHIMISDVYEIADGEKQWAVYYADDDGLEVEHIDGFSNREHANDYAQKLGEKHKLEVHEE